MCYYPFVADFGRCNASCNNLDDPSSVPNKKKDVNLNAFNMTTRINESKTLTKHISCECKCKLDGRKYNLNYDKDKC